MEFGREKCALQIMKKRKRKITEEQNLQIKWESETHQYLEILTADII